MKRQSLLGSSNVPGSEQTKDLEAVNLQSASESDTVIVVTSAAVDTHSR